MKFITKNSAHSILLIGYKGKYIKETEYKFFFVYKLVNINWENHTEEIIPKLSGACYAVRLIVQISNNTLKSIHNAYYLSIINYGVIFWDNSFKSGKVSTLHKEIVRIMAGTHPRTSCRSLFQQLEIQHIP
jgi:hypothetical protein